MSAFPNLHALAYGEGGQRLSAELRVEAADALERLTALERWKAEALVSLSEWHELATHMPDEFLCSRLGQRTPQVVAAYITALNAALDSGLVALNAALSVIKSTPAHDKEKP